MKGDRGSMLSRQEEFDRKFYKVVSYLLNVALANLLFGVYAFF